VVRCVNCKNENSCPSTHIKCNQDWILQTHLQDFRLILVRLFLIPSASTQAHLASYGILAQIWKHDVSTSNVICVPHWSPDTNHISTNGLNWVTMTQAAHSSLPFSQHITKRSIQETILLVASILKYLQYLQPCVAVAHLLLSQEVSWMLG
jgi:hypothetical protein